MVGNRRDSNYLPIFIFNSVLCICSWFMVFNTTFNNISYRGSLFYWWRKLVYLTDLSHNVVSSTPCHEQGLNSQLQWWQTLIAQVVVNPTTIQSRTPWSPVDMYIYVSFNLLHNIISYFTLGVFTIVLNIILMQCIYFQSISTIFWRFGHF